LKHTYRLSSLHISAFNNVTHGNVIEKKGGKRRRADIVREVRCPLKELKLACMAYHPLHSAYVKVLEAVFMN
jgi:hypothetical protein